MTRKATKAKERMPVATLAPHLMFVASGAWPLSPEVRRAVAAARRGARSLGCVTAAGTGRLALGVALVLAGAHARGDLRQHGLLAALPGHEDAARLLVRQGRVHGLLLEHRVEAELARRVLAPWGLRLAPGGA